MKLIVGLGNPGQDYEKTRHNVGFMVLNRLAQKLGGEFCDLSRWEAATLEMNVAGEKVVLLKPLTYMNNSGRSVGKFATYYKLEPKDIWVISDDVDLPLGTIRVRDTGSSGGHNGLKSINDALGTEDYYHIRIGVTNADRDEDTAIFVLNDFAKKEQGMLDAVINQTCDLIVRGLEDKQLTNHSYTVDEIR